MKVDVEELGQCKRRLQVEETPEVVQQAWEQAFTRVQKEARLPGFRKGKVPRSMIKLHFSDDVRQEVARRLIPEVYRQALTETQLTPVDASNAATTITFLMGLLPPLPQRNNLAYLAFAFAAFRLL